VEKEAGMEEFRVGEVDLKHKLEENSLFPPKISFFCFYSILFKLNRVAFSWFLL
jgi:hypothetical protein